MRNLRGLSVEDARKLARGAIIHDGAITEEDLPEVNKAKFALMEMDGVLSYEYDTDSFANVGGLQGLKDWLGKREGAFHDSPVQGIDSPRGVMLVGVQGGGKSLAAKSVAGLWGLPLLRLDMGAIYNKFFGESERNVREALAMAETMSPCVLWIDEIEKGIAVGDNDGGTSRRVLGTLLTWMAENRSKVFMVATANDIERLPPELIRKGRLDEIFFVDLPSCEVREDIFLHPPEQTWAAGHGLRFVAFSSVQRWFYWRRNRAGSGGRVIQCRGRKSAPGSDLAGSGAGGHGAIVGDHGGIAGLACGSGVRGERSVPGGDSDLLENC